jgi:FkbM family methyltransferase
MFANEVNLMSKPPVSLKVAAPEDVPVYTPEEINARFYLKKYVYGIPDGVHDDDFYYFRDLRDNIVFCDIGANTGQSINSLRVVGSCAQVHSFEINPSIWDQIEQQGCAYSGTFQLHKFGIGEKSGVFKLYLPVLDDCICHTLGSMELAELQSDHILGILDGLVKAGETAEWKVIATYCEVRNFDSLGLRPDIVKIDVEGSEAMVLAGMPETLKSARPVLLIENSDPIGCSKILYQFGYVPMSYDASTRLFAIGIKQVGNNTFFFHASDIVELKEKGLLAGGTAPTVSAADQERAKFELYTSNLAQKPTEEDVIAAFKTFLGVSPNQAQLAEHLSAYTTRREMRNGIIKYLMQHL